jgi:predicted RNA-binding protein associated with RNAse of E/G family
VIPLHCTYQVLHFWGEDGTFSGWYVNLEAPTTRRGTRLDTVDWHLDLWIDAAGVPGWKDEDEARAAVAAGHLPERDLELAWRTGTQIIEGLSDWREVVGDWRSFHPPAAWVALGLPSDWAQ